VVLVRGRGRAGELAGLRCAGQDQPFPPAAVDYRIDGDRGFHLPVLAIRPARGAYGLLNGCCQEADVDGTPRSDATG
jgi:hypothetical protein